MIRGGLEFKSFNINPCRVNILIFYYYCFVLGCASSVINIQHFLFHLAKACICLFKSQSLSLLSLLFSHTPFLSKVYFENEQTYQ